ncbi:dedicator of cytokinesis protein 7 isoform X1 [Aplysia californica]|uniref:Dedicator of cytokinesis protein 7 isoform X1 n=1 Tax=Aplysia californica TaxID=6500 RepID=A0ABM0JB41_APLCA|nr:dedicator of cytokinesis protein 7 isoform X1 [Aplysia californica]
MAASGQRAFAQKLSKQGAAEVRRQVSSSVCSSQDLSRSASVQSISIHSQPTQVPLNDAPEPTDFEDYVLQNQCMVERDPHKDLLLYPEDDIQVHKMPKTRRTTQPSLPEPGAEADPHVRDCVRRYTSDYTVVTRRYQQYSSSCVSKERLSDHNMFQHEYEIDVDELPEQDKDTNKRQSIHMNDTPRGSWASSIFDLKQSQADTLLPNLFDRISYDDVDRNNENLRQQNRYDNIFSLYPVQDEEEVIERRGPTEVPKEHFGHKILVKCSQLSLELEVEPIFVSMALYDSREKKKISETFHFDLNSESMKRLLNGHITRQDVSTMSRSCIFSITYPSTDVFLVIKLEKVLQQGDISECVEPYMKEDKSTKEEKYRAQAVQYCERLGKYRMPFAWTAIYLMNIMTGQGSLEREGRGREGREGREASVEKRMREASIDRTTEHEMHRAASLDVGQPDRRMGSSGSQYESFRKRSKDDMLAGRRGSIDRGRSGYEKFRSRSPENYNSASMDNFHPVTLTVKSFFKQEGVKLSDEDLYKFLADLKRPTSVLKKVKCIPVMLKLDISPCPEEPKFTLTPELLRVEPYPDDSGRPTKEVLEFPSREVFVPYTIYRNLLYVYPKSLNFANRQGSARNLAVKVQFLSGEDENFALPIIFGKSSCPEFTKEALAAVTYHNKSPDFYEEVKIKLPARLSDSHHLFFTFYHISCQVKKNEPTPTEVPVGYTWLPLYRDGRLVSGEFNLPVSVERPSTNYSLHNPDVQIPTMKWVDNHKGVFSVALKAESSVFPQDEHIDRFMNLYTWVQEQKIPSRMNEMAFENELKRSIMDIDNAKGENLVQFLPLILDKLIALMVRPPVIGGNVVNVGQATFEAISHVVLRVHELLEDKNDLNGRNALLAAYIQYSFSIPCLGLHHQGSSPNLGSPHGQGYATLGRPSSLPVAKANYHRSSSNPDLAGSTPTSPDFEFSTFSGRQLDRTGSMKGEDPQNVPKIRGKKLVHEELALQWVVSSDTTREVALPNVWFFLELMIKSMAEHLDQVDKLCAPRQMRFLDHFIDDVSSLVSMIIKEIADRFIKEPPLIKGLNTSLAFFLHDLMSLMDRGFVFQLIRQYCRKLSSNIKQMSDPTSLMLLRLDFLRIVCSHEHFLPLNLPFGTPLTPSGLHSPTSSISSRSSVTSSTTLVDRSRVMFYNLTPQFRSQHYLVGLVLSDLAISFEATNPAIHLRAISVLRNILYNHDLDVRYTDPEVKSRLAALYLPLIGIVIDALPQLHDPALDSHKLRGLGGALGVDEEGDKINQRIAMAIAGPNVVHRIHHSGSSAASLQSYEEAGDGSKNRKTPLSLELTRSLLACFLWVLKNSKQSLLRNWWSELPITRLASLLEVLYLAVSNFEYRHDAKWALPSVHKLFRRTWSDETLEDWTLNHHHGNGGGGGDRMADRGSPSPTLLGNGSSGSGARPKSHTLPKSQSLHEQLWEGIQRKSVDLLRGGSNLLTRTNSKEDSPATQGKKMVTQCSQQTLKKSVDMKSRLEEAILGTGNARTEMMMRRRQNSQASLSGLGGSQTPPPNAAPESGGSRLRWRKDQVQWRHSVDSFDSPKPMEQETEMQDEGSLAAEVSMICLDSLELIIQIAQNSEMLQPLLGSSLRVLLHMLALNQSTAVLQHLFATQRALVTKFLDLLFEEEAEQCAELCLRLLRHCSSPIAATRSQASASLYLLMRQNFELGNNFARVKMQVTMSLSSLVGQNKTFNEEFLRKSLKTILTYAENDQELENTSFREQVRDLVFNLHMILSDTVKMKEFAEDPEMLLDLMYRIAKGYQNSPDLRLTWLQNMARDHSQRRNHAEAAQCLVHAAGLVAEYLNMLEDKPYLPVGCVAFEKITSNVLEESAVSDDVVSPDEEGICTGMYFTENGLVGLLEQAAGFFNMASMFEAVNEVYKLMVPIYEQNRDYKKLALVHQKLHEAFTNITRQEGKRIFGTYFRVGFYGAKFGDLDGEEFIYKEQMITKLPEISHRLESFYGERFGHDFVEIVKDSNTVEKDKLDPEKAYIQITYVEPYFDMYEYKERITYFDKNYKLKRFIYATPFTLDGRAHGELHEQYKRKTILTTNHFFPYIKTRVSVIERKQIILSPVEVAIEDIHKKTRELALAMAQEPPDTKILQMVLQGCIGTTVNQGPLEVALVFLSDIVDGKQAATKPHNKLRLCFKDFIKKCGDALQRNKSLITSEQREYQRELERNYNNFREKISPMISTATLRKSKHHKSKEGKESRSKRHADQNVSVC